MCWMGAGGPVVVEDAHLDQPVGVQGGINFFLNRGGQAISTDEDHGVEVMGIGAVFPALRGSQLNLGHGRIIEAG